MQPTALVVDDDRDVLDMTASLLERNGLRVVAKDQDGESASQHLRDYRPDLAVMDVLLPGSDGLRLLQEIRRERLPTLTILVTGFLREAWLVQALELGVEGYLTKPHIPELILAVKAVLAGQRFLCPWAFGFVVSDYVRLKTEETTKGLLTPREIVVLKGRTQGKSVKEIAAEIDVSPKTVEKHVTNLRKKFGVHVVSNSSTQIGPVEPRILTKG